MQANKKLHWSIGLFSLHIHRLAAILDVLIVYLDSVESVLYMFLSKCLNFSGFRRMNSGAEILLLAALLLCLLIGLPSKYVPSAINFLIFDRFATSGWSPHLGKSERGASIIFFSIPSGGKHQLQCHPDSSLTVQDFTLVPLVLYACTSG